MRNTLRGALGVLTAAALTVAAAPGHAQVPRAKPAVPEQAPAGGTRDAIGRINHAEWRRVRHCTFAAVAPRVALTAEHCIRGVAPAAFHLLYGYARMAWVAEGDVADVRQPGRDLAVLCLADAAPATLDIGPPAAMGDRVHVVGYGQPAVHLQQEQTCTVKARSGEELLLDCAAQRGASGGPVLDEAGRLVGVMSRTGPATSVAAAVPASVTAACNG